MRAQTVLCTALLLLSAVLEVRAVRGVWRIYNTTDCSDEAHALIGVVVAESTLLERSCSQVSVGQYATFSPNTDGFDLQSFARAGSGWDIHMVFNTSNCGVFYDTIYIGKTGVCLNYVIQTSYLSYQSFMFYECDQQYGTSFYNFADFECSGYNIFEQVQANVSTCVVYSSFGSVNYRTTHCNGVATAPFNLTPFSTSNAHNKHQGLYYWRSVLYVIVVYSVMLITL